MNELFIANQLMSGWDDSQAFDDAQWADRVLDEANCRDAWHTWLTQ